MITKDIAIALMPGTTLWHTKLKNKDGTPARARVNGKCQTWKTRPDEFQLPVKYGRCTCFTIRHDRANEEWCLPERWEIERHWD